MNGKPNITRVWSMPSANTFDIPPIGEFVKKYLHQSKVSIDPFARNKRWATYTNDLNPDTAAQYHMDALEFLIMLKTRRVIADLVIFDPPYSRRQVIEVYEGIGKHFSILDSQYFSRNWPKERDIIGDLLDNNGIVLSFGWNSAGMGKKYSIEEIMIVCHGGKHNDTICMAECKIVHQPELF